MKLMKEDGMTWTGDHDKDLKRFKEIRRKQETKEEERKGRGGNEDEEEDPPGMEDSDDEEEDEEGAQRKEKNEHERHPRMTEWLPRAETEEMRKSRERVEKIMEGIEGPKEGPNTRE